MVGLQVRIERTKHKSKMNLVLYDLKLTLVTLRSHLTERFRHLSLTKSQNTLVLKVTAQGNLNKTLVSSHRKHQIIIVELSFKHLVCTVIVENRSIRMISVYIFRLLKTVKSNDDSLVVISEKRSLSFYWKILLPITVERELIYDIPNDIEATMNKLFINF